MENLRKVVLYARQHKYVSIPIIQREFDMTYPQAKSIVDQLVMHCYLKYTSGINYKYIKSDRIRILESSVDLSSYARMAEEYDKYNDEDDEEDDDDDDDDDLSKDDR